MIYPNLCYNEVCYKGTVLYIVKLTNNRSALLRQWVMNSSMETCMQVLHHNILV